MGKEKDLLKKFFQKGVKNEKLVLIILGAILVLVMALPVQDKDSKKSTSGTGSDESVSRTEGKDYGEYLEDRLTQMLSNVYNVGDVKVMVTLKNTSQKVLEMQGEYAENSMTEEDGEGGKRTSYENSKDEGVVYTEEQNSKIPYVVEEKMPEIAGVVIIAQNGDDPVTVSEITQAVEALLSVPTHKIKVLKMK